MNEPDAYLALQTKGPLATLEEVVRRCEERKLAEELYSRLMRMAQQLEVRHKFKRSRDRDAGLES